MTRLTPISLLLLVLCGCASLQNGEGGVMRRFTQSRNLATAKEQLLAGDKATAAGSLTAITEAGDFPGITDEALFRLALLNLHPALESNQQSLQLLKRLKKEYPASIWAVQTGQLLELLNGADELRRQVKSLKNHNQSLNSEVNELNRNIDQLKQLDQQLEKRRR